jgi:hypothetical protein
MVLGFAQDSREDLSVFPAAIPNHDKACTLTILLVLARPNTTNIKYAQQRSATPTRSQKSSLYRGHDKQLP